MDSVIFILTERKTCAVNAIFCPYWVTPLKPAVPSKTVKVKM